MRSPGQKDDKLYLLLPLAGRHGAQAPQMPPRSWRFPLSNGVRAILPSGFPWFCISACLMFPSPLAKEARMFSYLDFDVVTCICPGFPPLPAGRGGAGPLAPQAKFEPHRVIDARKQNSVYKFSTCGAIGPDRWNWWNFFIRLGSGDATFWPGRRKRNRSETAAPGAHPPRAG